MSWACHLSSLLSFELRIMKCGCFVKQNEISLKNLTVTRCQPKEIKTQQLTQAIKGKAKGIPYSWLSVGSAADPGIGSKKPAGDITYKPGRVIIVF